MSVQGIRAGKAFVELSVKENVLKKSQAALASLSGKLDAFAASASAKLASAFTIALPAGYATNVFADFDDQMRIVAAVSGATGKAFESLTEQAKELGRTTSFTASEVAKGMAELGRAGFRSSEIEKSIASVMALSKATATELPVATAIAGNALRAFGMEADDLGRVCDVLTATANGSAQTVEDLGEALKFVAPIAAQTGMTLEDTAKILGTLANFGIKGSNAGTAFKNMRTKMADTGVQEKYKSIGVEVVDKDTGALRNMVDVLHDLGAAVQNMPDADRLAFFKEIFGMYGLAGGSVLATADGFDELYKSIDNAAGAAEKTQAAMESGLGGSIRSTLSACEGLAIAFGDAVAPAVQEFGERIKESTGRIVEWISQNKTLISNGVTIAGKIAAVTVAVVAASKAISVLLGIVKGAMSVFRGVGAVLGFLSGATKAYAAAQAAANTVTATTKAVESAKLAVAVATTPAQIAAAQAALTTATAEQAEAVAAAEATAATLALNVALAGVIAVVAGLAVAAGAIAYFTATAEKGAKAAKEMTMATNQRADANAAARDQDRELFNELEDLASQTELTNEEFARGKNIIDQLTSKYGDLGIEIDDVAKKFNGAAEAKSNFDKKMRDAEKKDIEAQIKALENENAEIDKSIKKYTDDGFKAMAVNYGRVVGSWFGADTAAERVESLNNDKEANQKQLQSLRLQLEGMNELDAAKEKDAEEKASGNDVIETRQAQATSAEFESSISKDSESKFDKQRDEIQKEYSAYIAAQEQLKKAAEAKAEAALKDAKDKADAKLEEARQDYANATSYEERLAAQRKAGEAAAEKLKAQDDYASKKEEIKVEYEANLKQAKDWLDVKVNPIDAEESRTNAEAERNTKFAEAQSKVLEAQMNYAANATNDNKKALDDATKALKDVETENRQDVAQEAFDRLNDAATALKEAQESGNAARIEAAQAELAEASKAAATASDALGQDVAESISESQGTFDAFEAFDMTNDWEREAMEKQTEAIEEVADVAKEIKKAIVDANRDDNSVVFV